MKTARTLLNAIAICVGFNGATQALSQSNVSVPGTWNCEQLSNLNATQYNPNEYATGIQAYPGS